MVYYLAELMEVEKAVMKVDHLVSYLVELMVVEKAVM
jgi:hypothetical protein